MKTRVSLVTPEYFVDYQFYIIQVRVMGVWLDITDDLGSRHEYSLLSDARLDELHIATLKLSNISDNLSLTYFWDEKKKVVDRIEPIC